MKPWDELTQSGRFRRMRTVAANALAAYDVEPTRLRLIGGFTNVLFRVDTVDGPLALRVDLFQDHDEAQALVEAAWLSALDADTDLDVAHIVAARDGSPWVMAGAPGVPDERRCTLFRWIPGGTLSGRMTPENYFRLGALSARLTAHGARFVPPVRPMVWDRVFYWPDHIDPVVHDQERFAHLFTGGRREVLDTTIDVVSQAFARLKPDQAQVIHADIHPWNVHLARSRMIVLDFEDVAWAHPVQDAAITLSYGQDDPAYDQLRSAFTDGYQTIALWPESYPGEVDHFIAARTVMFVNFILNLGDEGPEPEAFYETTFPRLERFLESWA